MYTKALYNEMQVFFMNDRDFMSRVLAMERELYRIAQAMLWNDSEAADAIQTAIFKAWMKKGGLREERYFKTWLIRILINECRNIQRRKKPLPLDESFIMGKDEHMAEDLHLRQCLQRLPEKYRMPLLLHHLEGYSLAEIAEILNMKAELVKSRLYQGRICLKKLLKEGETYEAE